jgi:hypothetical protein
MLVFFQHSTVLTSRNPKNIVDAPAFLEHDLAKNIGVCAYTTCVPSKYIGGLEAFLYEAAQKFEVFSNIQI